MIIVNLIYNLNEFMRTIVEHCAYIVKFFVLMQHADYKYAHCECEIPKTNLSNNGAYLVLYNIGQSVKQVLWMRFYTILKARQQSYLKMFLLREKNHLIFTELRIMIEL